MKIRKIRIDGYKNINNTTIDFNGINALIALNNYGKSNFLEAIEFAIDFVKASNKYKSKLMERRDSVPINIHSEEKNFLFEIEFLLKNEIVNYLFSFEWVKSKNKGKRIVKEELKIKEIADNKPSTYIKRNITTKQYKPSKTGRCDKAIRIEEMGLIINKLLNYDELFYLDTVNQINNFEFDFIALYNIDKYFTPGFILNNEDSEVTEVPNIAKFFYEFSKQNEDKYEILKNSIIDLLPDIEYIKPVQIDLKSGNNTSKNIPFEIPEKFYDIRIKIRTNNQETSVKNISVGSKRIFHILTTAIISDFTGTQLITYEEIENSIHPALLQRLLIIISELTENTQILITSHSPHLVKYLDLNNIHIGIPNQEGLASFKKIRKSKQNKFLQYANDSESTLGDFIFDMLVESLEEESFWNEFI
jgi:predicted ATPase